MRDGVSYMKYLTVMEASLSLLDDFVCNRADYVHLRKDLSI